MVSDLLNGILRLVCRLRQDTRATVAVTFGVVLLPVAMATGAAIDYSRASHHRTAMQAALDAGLLAGAKDGTSSWKKVALDVFQANLGSLHGSVSTPSFSLTSADTYSGSVVGAVETAVLGIIHIPSIDVGAKAKVARHDYGAGCVLALNPSAKAAGLTVGTADVVLESCSLYDNSNNTTALSLEGGSHISALSVGVVGGISGQSNITTTKGVRTDIAPVKDPYAGVSFPPPGGCDYNNFKAPKNGTLSPGVYCNGMTFDGKANVTLNPGIYYVDRGSFYVAGGTTLKGTDVTLVFTSSTGSNWPTVTIQGGANIDLTAPTTGPLAGIVFFGDRKMSSSTLFRFAGGSSQYFGGSVYVPAGKVEFAGGTSTKTGCTKLIADTISFIGNTNLSLNCAGFGNGDRKIVANVLRLAE